MMTFEVPSSAIQENQETAPVLLPGEVPLVSPDAPMDQVIEAFLASQIPNRKTARGYRRHITQAMGMMCVECLGQLQPVHLMNYRAELMADKRGAATHAQALIAVRSFLTWGAALQGHTIPMDQAKYLLKVPAVKVITPHQTLDKEEIKRLENLDLGAAPDFSQDAHTALAVALDQLHALRKQREQEEADAAELARLRAEEDKRRQDQAEADRKEQEAQQRDREALEATQRTEPVHQDTEPAALDRAEVATHPEAERTIADLEHRRTYNREARADLLPVLGGDAETAKAILLAIYNRKIRHISITY